jgi:hypothetical protein
VSQRPIAIHALETPMKFDAGLYLFRKLLREAIRGKNKAASPEAFREWLKSVGGFPNTYCSGNVFDVAEAPTMEEEVTRRRKLAKSVLDIVTEADSMSGAERVEFIKQRMAELERSF